MALRCRDVWLAIVHVNAQPILCKGCNVWLKRVKKKNAEIWKKEKRKKIIM